MSPGTSARATPDAVARRARLAVAALFLTNGALFANVVPRFPSIKAELGLSNAAYGLAIAAFPTGAILAGLGAAVVIRRLGSARAAVIGTVITAVGVVAVGWSPSALAFGAALLFAGSADAITDVAQNTHGLRVQRRYGRSIINSFHALWSIGAVTGGAMAAAAIALDVPRGVHLSISGVLLSATAIVALRFCLPGPDTERDAELADAPATTSRVRARIGGRTALILLALVVVATAGTLVEDAGSSWAAVYLGGLGAPEALAATGFIALVGAQFVGRACGDRLVDRFGQRAVARVGGGLAALGMGLALAFPSVPGTIVGFATAGLGVATLVPAAMHEADELPGLRTGTGVTIVSWLMRLGFLVSPPIVGLVADATSLRVGLLVVPIAGVAALVLARVFSTRRTAATTATAADVEA
nr:MFS transporter [Litorihabitans aurantiacus]